MSRTTVFIFSLAVAVGLGLTQSVDVAGLVFVGLLMVGVMVASRKWFLVIVVVLGMGVALARGNSALSRAQQPLPTHLAVTGTVVAEKNGDAWLGEIRCGARPCPTGLVLPGQKRLGTRWSGSCQFSSLYGKTLWSWWAHGIVATCVAEGTWRAEPTTAYGRLLIWRANITDGFGKLLASHEAGLLNGIVLGDTSDMPTDTNLDFRRTGTSHIVALSGFNVTIILNALVVALMPLVGKRWTSVAGMALVVLFVVMTGAASSVVRAAVMAACAQAGRLIGRPLHPDRLLLYAICAMSLWNPFVLWHDLGFQLSVTSTFGLLRVRPALEQLGHWLPEAWEIRDNVLSTCAATLASGPLLIITFGQWSLVSVFSNTLVLPLIPVIMGLGALLTPLLWLPSQALHILIAPTELLLTAVLRTLHTMAEWRWSSIPIPPMGQVGVVLVLISLTIWAYATSIRLERAG